MALATLLSGCASHGGLDGGLDGRSFLEQTFQGPAVDGVDATLLKNAQDAEKLGNYPQAAQYYQQLLDKSPQNESYLTGYGEALRRSGQYDRAITFFDRALKTKPDYAPALEGRGLSEMAKGDFETAAKTFAAVMKAEPSRWRTLNALGILFTTKGLNTEAKQYFREAIAKSPNNPAVLNNMGLSQALDRDFSGAIATLEQAGRASATGSAERRHIDLNLALVHAVAGHLPEARAIAAQYFSGPALDNNTGIYAHLAKDDQLAKTYLNMALTQSKQYYARAWENLEALDAPRGAPVGKRVKIAPAAPEAVPAEPAPAISAPPASPPASAPAPKPQATPAAPPEHSPFAPAQKPAAAKPAVKAAPVSIIESEELPSSLDAPTASPSAMESPIPTGIKPVPPAAPMLDLPPEMAAEKPGQPAPAPAEDTDSGGFLGKWF